jgi:glucokinase
MSVALKGLVADIGGTNARFALVAADGRLSPPVVLKTADHPSLEAALAAFLAGAAAEHGGPLALEAAALCAAGPVEGGRVEMTNCPWTVSVEAVRRALGIERVALINDFTAVALALPGLSEDERHQIGGGVPEAGSPIGVLGPGTGLGVSGLVPAPDGSWIALSGEGGHADLAPSNPREIAVLSELMARHGHVSAERVLSGPGLENLYAALAALDGRPAEPAPDAREIAERARAGKCPIARETVALFCGWLGAVAGDLALILGARGGVYIAGGIVPRWRALGLLDEGLLRRRFEAKGRFRDWLAPVPLYLVTVPEPALIGLARLLA